jgi:hypothetical protein
MRKNFEKDTSCGSLFKSHCRKLDPILGLNSRVPLFARVEVGKKGTKEGTKEGTREKRNSFVKKEVTS